MCISIADIVSVAGERRMSKSILNDTKTNIPSTSASINKTSIFVQKDNNN